MRVRILDETIEVAIASDTVERAADWKALFKSLPYLATQRNARLGDTKVLEDLGSWFKFEDTGGNTHELL